MLQTRLSNNQVSRTNRTNTNIQFSTIQSSKQAKASRSPGHNPADSYLKLSDKTSQYSEGNNSLRALSSRCKTKKQQCLSHQQPPAVVASPTHTKGKQ